MQLNRTDIEDLDRIYRLNLINSISGIKPANLIGSRSKAGQDNVAIFSSIVHLGSNPAQLGFVMRPQADVPSDTMSNIQETGFYTINHVSSSFIKNAHYTSAKSPKESSEFDLMNLGRIFLHDFHAPFVKESQVKIGMKFLESIPLPNKCTFIIGSVELLEFPEASINESGQLDLESYACTGISGVNSYYGLKKISEFPYVGTKDLPDFK